VPVDIKSNMGPSEIEFFQQYDDALGEYMRTVNLDLTSFVEPPKEPYIEVRALQDCGEIVSNDGSSIRLDKNSTNLVRREDVEHLIKQGLLEQLS
jgi:GINS complex subunit 1